MNNSRYLIFSSVMSIKYLPGLFSLALYLTSGSSFSKSNSRPTAFLVILSKFSKPVLMSVTCCWRIESISKSILSLWMLLSVICFCVIALLPMLPFVLLLGLYHYLLDYISFWIWKMLLCLLQIHVFLSLTVQNFLLLIDFLQQLMISSSCCSRK